MTTRGSYAPTAGRVERATGVTDGSGNVTFTWPAGTFTAPPVVTIGLQVGAGFYSHRITANAAGSTTVNVLAAAGVTLLGIGVLAAGVPASGVTVHAHATAA
ncbi:hypothetical protein OOK58_42995 [Streptomyces sp. NBC_01728]|uniref:hypothetical protein n=1 Tax=unclassified Streptomyces TaxID=2593676 RepID=UPI00225845B9|nr:MULTISPECIES: hypothetical protein [unclassified Streptomyces]MCX4458680.1 hypothetical protein [Streptomyces sp. NBC_01719]MCX4498037.1 hypothetical protein [Streptomyces sp. NBC_01728]